MKVPSLITVLYSYICLDIPSDSGESARNFRRKPKIFLSIFIPYRSIEGTKGAVALQSAALRSAPRATVFTRDAAATSTRTPPCIYLSAAAAGLKAIFH